jgi:hypothetical protein
MGYLGMIFSPGLTVMMPPAGPFGGTAPRQSYSGLLGYYTMLTVFGGSGGGGGYPGGSKVASGVLLDPEGDPAEGYAVRAYDQATGVFIDEVLSEADGSFAFDNLADDPIFIVAIDQLADTWKAPIMDRIDPVDP